MYIYILYMYVCMYVYKYIYMYIYIIYIYIFKGSWIRKFFEGNLATQSAHETRIRSA